MPHREATKCADCNDLLWFDVEDVAPQAVYCPCGHTGLTESGLVGNFTTPSEAELASIP